MQRIEFDSWGEVPFQTAITKDTIAHAVLVSTRSKGKTILQIAREHTLTSNEVQERVSELEGLELISRVPGTHDKWIASIPIYMKSHLMLAEEIGCKYAAAEAEILRSALPAARSLYE